MRRWTGHESLEPLVLLLLLCLLNCQANGPDDNNYENDGTDDEGRDGRDKQGDALADLISAHRDDRENNSDTEEHESQTEYPKGKETKDKTNPTSFDG